MWNKLKVTRGNKEQLVFFSRAKAKYVRFTSSLMAFHKLEKKKTVDIFTDKADNKVLIAFEFKDDDKGLLKLGVNETGVGFISAASLFKELATYITKEKVEKIRKAGTGFPVTEKTLDGNKIFVVEIPKD